MSSSGGVLVVGQIGRDLVLRIDVMPEPAGAAPVLERSELLGGKGANQAVGLRQLGADVGLCWRTPMDPEVRGVRHPEPMHASAAWSG
jgi:sugar/nucleoside kinase (ribokinase family)